LPVSNNITGTTNVVQDNAFGPERLFFLSHMSKVIQNYLMYWLCLFQCATVYEVTAVCKYGDETSMSKTCTLIGIGKPTTVFYFLFSVKVLSVKIGCLLEFPFS